MDSGLSSMMQESYPKPETMSKTFLNFYYNNLHTDIELRVKCGDDWMTFPVHKLVLSLWSPVFADWFYKKQDDLSDGSLEILDVGTTHFDVPNVSPQAFGAMIKFMYGDVHDLHAQQRDISFLLKVYNLATQYEVEGLRVLCRNTFTNIGPSKENVFQLKDAIKAIGCEHLRVNTVCTSLLETKTAEVLNAQDLCEMTPDQMKIILNLDRVSLTSEYELISWVFAWVKNQHVKINNSKSFRRILDPFLPLLNILALKVEQFEQLLEDRPEVFTDSESLQIFRNIVKPGASPPPLWLSTEIFRLYHPSNV